MCSTPEDRQKIAPDGQRLRLSGGGTPEAWAWWSAPELGNCSGFEGGGDHRRGAPSGCGEFWGVGQGVTMRRVCRASADREHVQGVHHLNNVPTCVRGRECAELRTCANVQGCGNVQSFGRVQGFGSVQMRKGLEVCRASDVRKCAKPQMCRGVGMCKCVELRMCVNVQTCEHLQSSTAESVRIDQ